MLFVPVAQQKTITGKVIHVLDGDTIEILYDGKPLRIRLNGIDCPEKGQPFGTAAKNETARLCAGALVTVISHGEDRYGRTLGDVKLPSGKILNQELIKQGLAWHYKRYSNDQILADWRNPQWKSGSVYGETKLLFLHGIIVAASKAPLCVIEKYAFPSELTLISGLSPILAELTTDRYDKVDFLRSLEAMPDVPELDRDHHLFEWLREDTKLMMVFLPGQRESIMGRDERVGNKSYQMRIVSDELEVAEESLEINYDAVSVVVIGTQLLRTFNKYIVNGEGIGTSLGITSRVVPRSWDRSPRLSPYNSLVKKNSISTIPNYIHKRKRVPGGSGKLSRSKDQGWKMRCMACGSRREVWDLDHYVTHGSAWMDSYSY